MEVLPDPHPAPTDRELELMEDLDTEVEPHFDEAGGSHPARSVDRPNSEVPGDRTEE